VAIAPTGLRSRSSRRRQRTTGAIWLRCASRRVSCGRCGREFTNLVRTSTSSLMCSAGADRRPVVSVPVEGVWARHTAPGSFKTTEASPSALGDCLPATTPPTRRADRLRRRLDRPRAPAARWRQWPAGAAVSRCDHHCTARARARDPDPFRGSARGIRVTRGARVASSENSRPRARNAPHRGPCLCPDGGTPCHLRCRQCALDPNAHSVDGESARHPDARAAGSVIASRQGSACGDDVPHQRLRGRSRRHGRGNAPRLEALAPNDMTFETESAHCGARMEHDCG
jgi:hypothetical protein